MKLQAFIAVLFFLSATALAQPTERITKQYSNATEEYFVLKTDRSIKHGYYRQADIYGNIMVEGFFNHGLQSSLWKQYYIEGKLYAQGSYSGGYKAGVWEYYNRKGKLVQKYDFTAQKLVYFDPAHKNKHYKIVSDAGIIESKLKAPPVFIGGEHAIALLALQSLRTKSWNEHENIDVTIEVLVKKNGETAGHRIIASSHPQLNDIILNAVKTIPNFWIAGQYNGKPADVYYSFTLHFGDE